MNHIEFVQIESNNFLNPVTARVQLENLHMLPLDKAKECLELYTKYIALKEYDLNILNDAYQGQ